MERHTDYLLLALVAIVGAVAILAMIYVSGFQLHVESTSSDITGFISAQPVRSYSVGEEPSYALDLVGEDGLNPADVREFSLRVQDGTCSLSLCDLNKDGVVNRDDTGVFSSLVLSRATPKNRVNKQNDLVDSPNQPSSTSFRLA